MNDTTVEPPNSPPLASSFPPCIKLVGSDAALGQTKKNDLMAADSDFGALVYIVVVLFFYSIGKCSSMKMSRSCTLNLGHDCP